MLIFFSIKTAIILAIIAMLISFFFKPPLWLMQVLDIISLGLGTMMQGARMWLYGIVAMVVSYGSFAILIYLFPQFLQHTLLTLALLVLLFVVTLTASELLVTEQWLYELKDDLEETKRFYSRTLALLRAKTAGATGGAVAGGAALGSAMAFSSDKANASSRAKLDEDDDHYFRDEPMHVSAEEAARKQYDKETNMIFDDMEEQWRIEEDLRIHREMEEMNRFNEELQQFTDDSMTTLQDSMDDLNHFQDMHDDFNDTMDHFNDTNDFYHSNDDFYSHHNDHF